MESSDDRRPETAKETRPTSTGVVPAEGQGVSPTPQAGRTAHPEHQAEGLAASPPPAPPEARAPSHPLRKWLLLAGVVVGLAVGVYFLVPWVVIALNTVSTDDAYVNGHVTFVAPRVAGQVTEVLVDDNYRVKRGDVLVRLDREPYEVQVAIKKATVVTAEADLRAAKAQVRSQVAQAHANRYKLQHSMEDVNTQVANLKALVASLRSKQATLKLDEGNLQRGKELRPSGAISKEELDRRQQTVEVDKANVQQALQEIYALRAGLGLPLPKPEKGKELTDKDLTAVPDDLAQTFSTVQSSLAALTQSAAQFGYYPTAWDTTPQKTFAEFYQRDPLGYAQLILHTGGALGVAPGGPPAGALAQHLTALDFLESEALALDRILPLLIANAPAIKQAEAKLLQAKSDLAQAELNLRYCDIVSEIDGAVTRRNINPGNNVQVGQSLMAVRSLREIWVDANFKETQLADLRIGQRVRCEVDMYGSRREYEGRITGFTMGTGQTLALLPPQNATGNFVKIVQRLPVRIDFPDYDPDRDPPLFAGLSVEPYVYFKEPVDDRIPNAGKVLQGLSPLPQGPTAPTPQSPMVSPPQGPIAPRP